MFSFHKYIWPAFRLGYLVSDREKKEIADLGPLTLGRVIGREKHYKVTKQLQVSVIGGVQLTQTLFHHYYYHVANRMIKNYIHGRGD